MLYLLRNDTKITLTAFARSDGVSAMSGRLSQTGLHRGFAHVVNTPSLFDELFFDQ